MLFWTIHLIAILPHNIIFNHKSDLSQVHVLLHKNVQHTTSFFPGWNIVFDTDTTCLDKMKKIPFLKPSIHDWYQEENIFGKFKSDLCRLVQLYLHGGIYFDNDFELMDPSFIDNSTFLSVKSVDDQTIFQALIMSESHHPVKNIVAFISKICRWVTTC
jgi:hypothetical protein